MTQAPPQDTSAFARLYEEVVPSLLLWADLRIPRGLRRHVDPDDVMSEVWIRALPRFPDFDPDKGTFRGWLFGFATRVLMEALRKVSRMRQQAPVCADPSSDREPDVAEEATTICRKVARSQLFADLKNLVPHLDQEERTFLLHRGLENLPHEDIARRLGISVAASKKRWQRLRERLVEALPEVNELFAE